MPLPTSLCVDVDGLGSGTKVLEIEETCGSTVESVLATINVADLGFELEAVDVHTWEARPGMTIGLMVTATAGGLDVDVDFGEIDPTYLVGSETVVDIGNGTYTVQYTLPSTSVVPTGVYSLPVTLTDPATTKTRTWDEPARVRFTPQRSPLFAVTGDRVGELLFADAPSTPPLTFEAEIVANSLTVTGSSLLPGDVTTLRGQFDVYDSELTRGTATIYLSESGANGVIAVPVAAIEDSCWTESTGSSVCRYDFSVDLTMRPFADNLAGNPASTVAVNSQISVGVGVSLMEPQIDDPLDLVNIKFSTGPAMNWFPSGQAGQYTIRGRVSYSLNVITPQEQVTAHAFYGKATTQFVGTPLRDTRVEVRDNCGSIHQGLTHEDGAFELIFPTTCPHLQAQVWVLSEGTRGYVRVDVRDTQGDLHEFAIGTTFAPSTAMVQTLPDASIGHLLSGPHNILQQLMELQRWSKAFLGDANVNVMPWAYGVYERDWCPTVEGTSQYDDQTSQVEICSGDGVGDPLVNRDEFDRFVILHEGFHWFHDQFLIQGLDNDTYAGPTRDATEGFANAMAVLMTGSHWIFERLGGGDAGSMAGANVFKVESLDFNGHITTNAATQQPYSPWLPVDLWGSGTNSTVASTTGGWAGRILWDMADPEEPTVQERSTIFTRGPGGQLDPNVATDFDTFGGLELFADALTGYLYQAPANPALPPLDGRGFDDVDAVEFLDGVVCRSNHAWDSDVELLVNTVMDFQQYHPQTAPLSCP